MKKKIIISGILILIGWIFVFLWADKCTYLSKGISVFSYEILPFNTQIQGDHNLIQFYAFVPRRGEGWKDGYGLETQLYFQEMDSVPTVVYDTLKQTKKVLFIYRIDQYGYNDSNMIIKVTDLDRKQYYISPKKLDKPIQHTVRYNGREWTIFGSKYISVFAEDANHNDYKWVDIWGTKEHIAVLIWFFSFPLFPIYIIVFLVLINKRRK